MPNWCYTTYKVVGDKKSLNSLFNIIKEIDSNKTPTIPNDFGNMWLGCLVNKLGEDYNTPCRGEILDYFFEDNGDTLCINQETAWCEQEGVRKAIKKAYPNLKVYYCEEEPGLGVFATNDDTGMYFTEKYCVDSSVEELMGYYKSLKELIDIFEKVTDKHGIETEEQLEAAIREYNEELEEEDGFCYFRVIEYINDEP